MEALVIVNNKYYSVLANSYFVTLYSTVVEEPVLKCGVRASTHDEHNVMGAAVGRDSFHSCSN